MDTQVNLLKNLINTHRKPQDSLWNSTLERIGQEFFNEEKIKEDFNNFYIMDGKWESFGSKASRSLGVFERDLLERIKHPSQPVIVLKGCIGSGKTSTCNYIESYLKEIFSTSVSQKILLNLPLIPHINCTRIDIPKKCDETEADHLITDYIMYALDAAINDSGFRENESLETCNFWNYSLERNQQNQYEYWVFNVINSALGKDHSSREARQKLCDNLRSRYGNKFYLSYLFNIFGYIRHELCFSFPESCYIVIDNVDQLQVFAQRRLLELISSNVRSRDFDPVVLLSVRPEARMYKSMGTNFLDVISQRPPATSTIISQRIILCLENLSKNKDRIINNEFLEKDLIRVEGYLTDILRFLNYKSPFAKFVSNAADGSARLALLLANGILQIDKEVLSTNRALLTQNSIISSCITKGQKYHSPSDNHAHPIHNIFQVDDKAKISALLIKTRILAMLHKDMRLTNIIDELDNFGYEFDLQFSAINDLLRIPIQLIISSGTEEYKDINDFLNSPLDEIKRTELGKNYFETIIKEPTYIQEMMINTWVPIDRFHSGEIDNTLLDRFDLLYRFLASLIAQDYIEVKKYLVSVKGDTESYRSLLHTSNLITYDILETTVFVICKIISTAKKNETKRKKRGKEQGKPLDDVWEKKIEDFNSILDWAQHQSEYCFSKIILPFIEDNE